MLCVRERKRAQLARKINYVSVEMGTKPIQVADVKFVNISGITMEFEFLIDGQKMKFMLY